MKKIIALLTVAVLALSLAACGSSGTEDKGSAANESKDTLIMATNAAFPPYEYYEGDDIVGIDAEIAQAYCR